MLSELDVRVKGKTVFQFSKSAGRAAAACVGWSTRMSARSPALSQRTREGQGTRFCVWWKHGPAAKKDGSRASRADL